MDAMAVPQVVAKVGDKKEQILVIKNEGSKSAQNIAITGLESGLITIKSETPAVVKPATPVEPAKTVKAEPTAPVVDPTPVTPPVADTSCLNKTLAAGETCQVTIVFAPTEVASGKETISVAYSSESGAAAKTTSFDVPYLAKGEVTLDIPALAQLKAEVSKTDKKTLTITNKSANAITGIKIADLASPLSITGNTCKDKIEKGQSCDIEVTFAPADLMDTKQNLQITYNDVDEEGNEVPVTTTSIISYQTIGKADLSLTSYADYLISNIDKDSTIRTYTIKNNGNGKATLVTLPTLVKPLSIKLDSSTCKPVDGKSFELAKGASCAFDVTLNSDKIDEQKDVAMVVTYNDGTAKKSAITTINYKTVAANVLNLSKYTIANSFIGIDTPCSDKEIYGNGVHNIQLKPNLTFTTFEGNEDIAKELNLDDVLLATQPTIYDGTSERPMPFESNEITRVKNPYSKCSNDALGGSDIPDKGLFFKTKSSGKNVVIGAKLQYVDKSGKISEVKTIDSSRLKLKALVNPYGVSSESKFKNMGIVFEHYSSSLAHRTNYRLTKISPNLTAFKSLQNFQLKKWSIFNNNSRSGREILVFVVSKQYRDVDH
ncbi:MAG: choice-of-anchor D domain-containing protein, partial [Silvanigrellaceae bacterium]|nr:choice-of-anchor D domain-containing protein [Silvanigrellaceae bacterium]